MTQKCWQARICFRDIASNAVAEAENNAFCREMTQDCAQAEICFCDISSSTVAENQT